MFLKGRLSIIDLIDRPFYEVHELYRIVFLKAEEEKKAEEQREKEEAKSNGNKRGRPAIPNPSKIQTEALEDALEDLAEGGI